MSNYTVRQISETAFPLTKEFEGFRSDPYLDMVKVPTIGYGSTYYEDGTKVTLADKPITESRARFMAILILDNDFSHYVFQKFADVPGITLNMLGALADFAYNVGIHALDTSTLCKRVLAGDFDSAASEFLKWDMAGGKHVPGLLRRRQAEKDLFTS